MKLKTDTESITIDNNDDRAQRIMQGYSWTIKNGKLTIGSKTEYDLKSFETKLKNSTYQKKDLDDFLIEMIKIFKQTKWQI